MNRLYIPAPTPAWRSDSVGTAFIKAAAFLAFLASAAGLVQFLEILRG
jgi:hypothetical protein